MIYFGLLISTASYDEEAELHGLDQCPRDPLCWWNLPSAVPLSGLRKSSWPRMVPYSLIVYSYRESSQDPRLDRRRPDQGIPDTSMAKLASKLSDPNSMK